jgi:hypothetical protein
MDFIYLELSLALALAEKAHPIYNKINKLLCTLEL